MYTECIERVVSYLLTSPENRDEFRQKVNVLDCLTTLSGEHLTGVDWLLNKMITQIYSIRIGTDQMDLSLDQESLERYLSIQIQSLLTSKEFNLDKEIKANGLGYNMAIPKDVEDCINFFYEKLLESIDTIYSSKVTELQARLELETLKQRLSSDVFLKGYQETSQIFNTENKEEAFKAMRKMNAEIDRLQYCDMSGETTTNGGFVLSDYSALQRFLKINNPSAKDLFQMKIDPYDKSNFWITSQTIALTIAGTNVGKTRFTTFQIYQCLISGVNCSVFSTETQNGALVTQIILVHLFYMYGYTDIDQRKLDKIRRMKEENDKEYDKYKIILDQFDHCSADLVNNPKYGKLSIGQNMTYEGSKKTFLEEVKKNNSKVVFIDHIRALSHEGTTPEGGYLRDEKSSLAYLINTIVSTSRVYDIGFFLTSHQDSNNKKEISIEAALTSPDIGAGAVDVTQGSGEIFVLKQTLDDKKNDCVRIAHTKTRGVALDSTTYVLRRLGSCSVHMFDENLQTTGNENLDNLENLISVS